jgi:hypothetical protein
MSQAEYNQPRWPRLHRFLTFCFCVLYGLEIFDWRNRRQLAHQLHGTISELTSGHHRSYAAAK